MCIREVEMFYLSGAFGLLAWTGLGAPAVEDRDFQV